MTTTISSPVLADDELLKQTSVLYVEDDDEARTQLARYLRRRVGRLDEAVNGQEGLERFMAEQFDVVVADVKMPVMDGLEMAARIKAATAEVPVVIVTAYSDFDAMQRAIEVGVDRYVTKPVNPDVLLQALVKAAKEGYQRRELVRMQNLLIETLHQTVFALSRAIELRDPYTAGHQQRVAKLVTAIARRLELPEESVQGAFLGAVVHDIGKISIPAEVLVKPSRLNEAEFALLKRHAEAGYELLKDIRFPWPIAEIVHQHHERLDGSGYPQGLKGDAIVLEARILAVADVVEAMSAHRPYRPAIGVEAALEEIKANRGISYDAAVVDACLAAFEDGFRFEAP